MGARGRLPRGDGAARGNPGRRNAARTAPQLPKEVQDDIVRYYRALRVIADRYMTAADVESRRRGKAKDPGKQEKTLSLALRAVHATLQAGRHWGAGGPAPAEKDPLSEHLSNRD